MAVQILGGVGYTKEYAAEQLLRDVVVMPIYEGTSQIQSLMAMKDTLGGIIKTHKASRQRAQARWRAMSARCPPIGVSRAYRAYHCNTAAPHYAYGCS